MAIPVTKKNKYIRIHKNGKRYSEHRLTIERKIGRKLNSKEIVHHINGDPSDNRIKNLKVMSQSEHIALHNAGNKYTKGRKRSEKEKLNLSIKMSGKNNPFYKKKHSKKSKDKMSASQKKWRIGRKLIAWNKGKKCPRPDMIGNQFARKNMKLHNNFPEESRYWLEETWCCWWCGENTPDCLHHIVGRGNKQSKVESSILNAAPLCNQKCHLAHHSLLKTDKYIAQLLQQTYKYLINQGYILNRNDKAFMLKYAKYYKEKASFGETGNS